MTAISRFSSAVVIVASAAVLIGWFAILGTYRLFDPDEGRYAEIPREMMVSGDWTTPRLNDIQYFEKPPLQYWATAVAFELFGTSEWTARLWTALSGFLGIALTAWLAHRWYGSRAAILAAAVQAGSVLYVALAHLVTIDMSLCFSLQVALAGLAWLVRVRGEPHGGTGGALLLALGVALAFLSKGLVGILIPAAVAGIYMLVSRDWGLFLRSRPHWSVMALLALAGPWVLAVSQRNPDFLRFFFIHEHFERFLTRVHARYESDSFFVPVLLVGFLPWTPLLPQLIGNVWRWWRARDGVTQVLAIWVIFIFVFFSVSQSKLIPYILPLFPALALLAGRLLAALPARRLSWSLGVTAGFWLLLATAMSLAQVWPAMGGWLQKAGAAMPGLTAAIWAVGIATALAVAAAARGHVVSAVCLAALGSLIFTGMALPSAQKLPKGLDTTAFLEAVRPHLTSHTRLYCVDDYEQPLIFYLKRTCTLVRYRGELDFGLRQEPSRWIADLESFAAQWQIQNDAVAFLPPATYEQVRGMNIPMRVIRRERTLIAIARQ